MSSTPPAIPNPQVSLEYGPPISLELAKRMLETAEAEAARNGWPMAIAIVDSAARMVAFHRMDNTQNGSSDNARWKAETAANYRRSTKLFEDAVAGAGLGLRVLSQPNVMALEGGLPIVANGKVIGAIGVSGMHTSQDAQVARAGLAAIE